MRVPDLAARLQILPPPTRWFGLYADGRTSTSSFEGFPKHVPNADWRGLLNQLQTLDLKGSDHNRLVSKFLGDCGYQRLVKTGARLRAVAWQSDLVTDQICQRIEVCQNTVRLVGRKRRAVITSVRAYRHEYEKFSASLRLRRGVKRDVSRADERLNALAKQSGVGFFTDRPVKGQKNLMQVILEHQLPSETIEGTLQRLTGVRPMQEVKEPVAPYTAELMTVLLANGGGNRLGGGFQTRLTFNNDAEPVVLVWGDEPLSALLLEAYCDSILSDTRLCSNPKCGKVFRRSRNRETCSEACKDYLKLRRRRTLLAVTREWDSLSRASRKSVNETHGLRLRQLCGCGCCSATQEL
jgi:hypothetical protein